MSYLLDTNVCIAIMKGAGSALTERVLQRAYGAPVLISSIVLFELQYGVHKSGQRESNRQRLIRLMSASFELIEFSAADAEAAGKIRADLEAQKQPIGPFDTLIAGQAMARNLVLVTANHREFERVDGLRLEDWAKA